MTSDENLETELRVRVEPEFKKEIKKKAKDSGLSLSAFVRSVLKKNV